MCGDLTSFVAAELAKRYQTEGINAYVDLIQNKERELGVDIITHQKWFVPSNLVHPALRFLTWFEYRSGANYIDGILTTVSSGSASTSAVGEDSTENQFH